MSKSGLPPPPPRRPKHYRPVKTGELIGMDAIELRMGELRRYVITMLDECSNYALALAVPSLNSDIVNHFFSRAARLFPVGISQIITDNGKEFLGNFDKTLQEAAIKHLWTYPYTPKMNAIYFKREQKLQYAAAPYKIFTLLSYYVKTVFLFIFPKIISHLLTGGFI